ncbi:pyocin knob domain-containing protein [Paenibacillus nitricinens]|uniref:pyocin knob domain-containing protein n=1 Tax=Paenibacillus nitricinens TaxID=3367691 RepID=UPI003F8269DA
MAYNKQQWKDEIPDLTKPIRDSSGKQKTDPQTGRPLYELVQEGTRLTSQRLNHIEDGIENVNELADQNATDIDTHKKDIVKHITAAERAEWKAKETPAGAQTKADAALSAAKTYADTALLAKADKSSTYSKTETDQRIQAVVGAAPDALDTLKEIGDALNNDPNFAATVTNQLSGKVDKVAGKQLSTEDYSSSEKAKLAGLTPGAGGAGSATDATIGNRTADPSIATPYSLTGTITQWFSWLTKYLKAITGKANPFDTPDITLAATKTHVDNTTVHITAAERTAWNAAETNAKNAFIPKTEKGVAGGVAALDATKLILSDGIILASRVVERVFNFSFANGVANQKIDVILPVNGGVYEIEVIGSFNTINTAGKLVKRFNGTYSNPASYPTGSQYTEVTGVVKSHISIGEPFFDSDLKWRVPLESRTTAPNPFTVIVRVLSGGGAATAPTLSAVYTGTAETTLPVAVQAIPDDTITQSGYLIQKHKLTENDGSATTVITGSVDTLVTSGWYTVQSTSVNGLPLTGTTGMLEVVGYMQRFTETPSMRSWKRRLNAGTWNAWVEDENSNRKNVSNGYAGLDSAGAINVDKVIAPKVRTGSFFRKHLGSFTTTQNVANEKIDIIFPVTLSGYMDVVITGAYGYQQSFGELRKRLSVYTASPDTGESIGTIYNQETRYEETIGPVSISHAISDLFYDAASKTYRMRISKLLVISGNTIQVYIEGLASNASYADNFDKASLGTVITSDSSAPALPVRTFVKPTTFKDIVNTETLSTRMYTGTSYRYSNLASYGLGGATTGTMKITLPVGWTQAMMRIKISGYEYVTGKGAWELLLGGYNFTTGWAQTTANIIGNPPFNSVRFAYDGSKCCILLGGVGTAWNFPQIEVSEVLAGHTGASGLGGVWSVAPIAVETGITNIVSVPMSYGNANTLNGYAPSVAAAPNTIALRNAKGELEGVSSTLVKVDDTPITNSSSGIMALNYNVTGTDQTLAVSAYLSLMSASNFSMYISYTDPRLGLKNYEICPLKRLESEAYVFIPAFIRAKAGSEVRLMVVHSDDAYPAYITASIGKE